MEDDIGRSLDVKPAGDFRFKVMSVEEMVNGGLNVNSLHEEVDPLELMDFSECKGWEDALRVSREASSALDHMKADGWEVDTRSWCNEVRRRCDNLTTSQPHNLATSQPRNLATLQPHNLKTPTSPA